MNSAYIEFHETCVVYVCGRAGRGVGVGDKVPSQVQVPERASACLFVHLSVRPRLA